MKTFPERLQKAIDDKGEPKGKLAKHCGVALSSVSRWLAGSVPREDKMKEIAEFLGVDPLWLAHGLHSTLRENAKSLFAETSISPNLLMEEGPTYDANKWKTMFEDLIETADPLWLVHRVEELQALAFEGDEKAKNLLVEILPRLRKRLEQRKE
jgi:transcriptional regulator with XRE-family HTH domain